MHQKFGIPGDLRRLLPFVPRVGAGDKGESGVVLDPAVLERFLKPKDNSPSSRRAESLVAPEADSHAIQKPKN